MLIDDRRNYVLAEVMMTFRIVCIVTELLEQETCVEDIDPH